MATIEEHKERLSKYTEQLFLESPGLKVAQKSFQADALFRAAIFTNFSSADVDQFNRTVRLGDGIDIRSFLSAKSFAFVDSAYVPPKVKTSESVIEYLYGSSSVASSIGGGTALEASLATSKFSIGPSFKSSSLQEQQSERVSGHLVIKFKPSYEFTDLADEHLTAEASALLSDQGPRAFYGRYGTHFVGAVQPDSVYAAIFSFYFDTQTSRQTFEKELGLKLGIMSVFSADFSQKTKTALQKVDRQVSFNFREFSASEVGIQPLPVPAPGGAGDPALELLTPGKLIERYNHYVTSLPTAANVPIVRVRLRPFAEIIAPAISAKIPTSSLELSVSVKADIDDLLSDYNVMIQNPQVWKATVPGFAKASTLSLSRDKLIEAMLDVFIDPSPKNITAMTTMTSDAAAKAADFFKTGVWPGLTAVKLSSLTPPTPPDTALTVELKFRCDVRLTKPLITIYGNKADAAGTTTLLMELIKDESEVAADMSFWRTGPIKITPVPGTSTRVESMDGVGRTREAILFAGADQTTPQIPSNIWTEMY